MKRLKNKTPSHLMGIKALHPSRNYSIEGEKGEISYTIELTNLHT